MERIKGINWLFFGVFIFFCLKFGSQIWQVYYPSKSSKASFHQRYMTRIEMVRLMHKYSLVQNHSKSKKACAKRFIDVLKPDVCKVELLFYVGAVDYDEPMQKAKFSPDKFVKAKTFANAFKILFGSLFEVRKDKNAKVPYKLGLHVIIQASQSVKVLKKAAIRAFKQREQK